MKNKIVIGNWKMNKTLMEAVDFVEKYDYNGNTLVGIAPTALHIGLLKNMATKTNLNIVAQYGDHNDFGARTGSYSMKQLADLGIKMVLVGHSERRVIFGESDDVVAAQTNSALKNGMVPILCVGESLQEYEKGDTEKVIRRQLETALKALDASQVSKVIIAYEPVWAIGTGKTATAQIANTVCEVVAKFVQTVFGLKPKTVPVLYGGSVKPETTKSLLEQPSIDGLLVGGAALELSSFKEILKNVA